LANTGLVDVNPTSAKRERTCTEGPDPRTRGSPRRQITFGTGLNPTLDQTPNWVRW
jgi:hypothetical protein